MDTKTKKRIPSGTPRYHRLTSENRITIRALRKVGISNAEIARQIGRSATRSPPASAIPISQQPAAALPDDTTAILRAAFE